MSYVLTGKLQGLVTPERAEPLADATVRLYRTRGYRPIGRPLDIEPRFAALTPGEVKAKEYLWTAQARTNQHGEFTVDLSEPSLIGHVGSAHPYAGEPLEVDVYCRSAPGQPRDAAVEEIQFTVGIVCPRWRPMEGGQRAEWEWVLSQGFWSRVKSALDSWTILGRVTSRAAQIPLSGLRVYAFDADLVQDDPLGTATTNEQGRFRIDFSGRVFRQTPGPGVDFEVRGPDVYFRVQRPDGTVLDAEQRSRASAPDRRDVGVIFDAELVVDA